jgi:hypothetical protein
MLCPILHMFLHINIVCINMVHLLADIKEKKLRCYCKISSALQSSVWFKTAVFSFKVRLLVCVASLPGDPGRLAIHTYALTFDTSRPVKARHIYVIATVETSLHGQPRHTHLPSYRGNLTTRAGRTHSFT